MWLKHLRLKTLCKHVSINGSWINETWLCQHFLPNLLVQIIIILSSGSPSFSTLLRGGANRERLQDGQPIYTVMFSLRRTALHVSLRRGSGVECLPRMQTALSSTLSSAEGGNEEMRLLSTY